MADSTTNFFINSAFSPGFDITWSFQFKLTGYDGSPPKNSPDDDSTGGFSTFLFNNNNTISSTKAIAAPVPGGGKYTGLGFDSYNKDAGVTGAAIGVMIDTNNQITIKDSSFTSLTSFKIKYPPTASASYKFINQDYLTMRFTLTDSGQTFKIAIKDAKDIYYDIASVDTGLTPGTSDFYKIGVGSSNALASGDTNAAFIMKDIITKGSLTKPTTKVVIPPTLPVETFYIIQSSLSGHLDIEDSSGKVSGSILHNKV